MSVCLCVCVLWLCSGLQVGASICDEEVSSRLGPHGAAQAAAPWSIIYYRIPPLLCRLHLLVHLLLRCVTNALRRDQEIQRVGVPEVNAALLTLDHPSPDEYCHCLIWEKKKKPCGEIDFGKSFPQTGTTELEKTKF